MINVNSDLHDEKAVSQVKKVLQDGIEQNNDSKQVRSTEVIEVLKDDHVTTEISRLSVVQNICMVLISSSLHNCRISLLNICIITK